ncbi:MAG TPA: hypothetical protein VH414_17255 [Lichenihabitans sp.]|jgi:hypothetical protein|nr:hypothetical protein [Lichenihabitans sp.]
MRIEIRVDRVVPRRWHLALKEAIEAASAGAAVRFTPTEGAATLPGPVTALIALERLVVHRSRPTLCDMVTLDGALLADSDFRPDAVIDCSGAAAPAGGGSASLAMRPLYDGDPSEAGLVAAILAGAMPEIAIENLASGEILATGQPSSEAAQGLIGGIVSAVTRVVALVEQILLSPRGTLVATPGQAVGRQPKSPAAFALRNLVRDCTRAIYHLCFYSPHWRIGWRWHDGPGVAERGDLGGPAWQVLRDPGRRFFADPFPVTWNGRTVVFFEDLDHKVGKGVISAVELGPEGPLGEVVTVLEEPWHMSYPFVMEHDGALWMVPESSLSGTVPLYRCVDFPHRWERVGTIAEGIEAADCTIFPHDGRLWMMGAVRPGHGGYSDILAIYHASSLLGPWQQHDRRPVLVDVAAARPAGAVVARNGALLRPVQDCTLGYGRVLALARIDRLTTSDFAQTILHRIAPGPLWPGKRLHTLNRCGPLECIDGTTYNPRLGSFRAMADARMVPAREPGRLATA